MQRRIDEDMQIWRCYGTDEEEEEERENDVQHRGFEVIVKCNVDVQQR